MLKSFIPSSLLCLLMLTTCAISCTVPNPDYHPRKVCHSSAECAAPTGVCNIDTGACVQCTSADSSACSVGTPICGIDYSCHRCTLHSECASNVCRPDGSCSDGSDVAYVAQGGTGSACTQIAPCALLSTALELGKPLIKMAGTIADNAVIRNQNVTILASPGTRLVNKVANDGLQVSGSSQVSIFDLEIFGTRIFDEGAGIAMVATQSGNSATLTLDRVLVYNNYEGVRAEAGTVHILRSTFVDNGEGVSATIGGIVNISQSAFSYNDAAIVTRNYTGTMNISRSTVSQNSFGIEIGGGTLTVSRSMLSHNDGRAIQIEPGVTSYYVVNNFIIENGAKSSPETGGIFVAATAANSKMEFNTIVDNLAGDGAGRSSGIQCTGKVVTPNNLIFRNTGGEGNAQVSADCNPGNSLLTAPDAPGFVGPTDYHLTANSPPTILNVVDCPSDLEDYDGDHRPVDSKCDLGADEYRPLAASQ